MTAAAAGGGDRDGFEVALDFPARDESTGGGSKSNDEKLQNSNNMVGAVCNMVVAILGPGLLTVPYAIGISGLWMGTGMFVVTALVNDATTMQLIEASSCLPAGVPRTYGKLARHACGLENTKTGKMLDGALKMVIALFLFGCICGNLVAVYNLADMFCTWAGININPAYTLCILLVGVVLPLCCVRDMKFLGKYSSPVGVFALVTVIVAVVARASYYFAEGNVAHNPPLNKSQFLLTFPIATFTFSVQPYLFSIFDFEASDHSTTKERLSMVRRTTHIAMTVAFILYTSVAVFGVLQLGGDINTNVLLSYCPKGQKGCPDTLTSLLSLVMVIAVVVCLPINLYPLRAIIDNVLPQFECFQWCEPERSRMDDFHYHRISGGSDNSNTLYLAHTRSPALVKTPVVDPGARNAAMLVANANESGKFRRTASAGSVPRGSVASDVPVSSANFSYDGAAAPDKQFSWARYMSITLFVLGICSLPALLRIDMGVVFDITGATACFLCSYVLPSWFLFRLTPRSPSMMTRIISFLFVFGGTGATIASLYVLIPKL